MMHFFIRPKIHLDCFTSRADVIEYAPVVSGMEVIPDWWKALPKIDVSHVNGFSPAPTMKTCVGMHEYYKKSIAMPLWSELFIDIDSNKQYKWQFSDLTTEAHIHGAHQYLNFLTYDNQAHLKIRSPWFFKCKKDISWLMTEPIYNRATLRAYTTPTGILNFYKQGTTNIQLFIDVAASMSFSIPFRTPFLFTPMSDKKIVVHRHLIDEEQFHRYESLSNPITFINKYKSQQNVVKCPYKDHTK
jgi:hypothetical protein